MEIEVNSGSIARNMARLSVDRERPTQVTAPGYDFAKFTKRSSYPGNMRSNERAYTLASPPNGGRRTGLSHVVCGAVYADKPGSMPCHSSRGFH